MGGRHGGFFDHRKDAVVVADVKHAALFQPFGIRFVVAETLDARFPSA